jgi:hypothetical protein
MSMKKVIFFALFFSIVANTMQEREVTSRHDKLIELPEEMNGSKIWHTKCDCNDLVKHNHYCGVYAITHAIDINQMTLPEEHENKRQPSHIVRQAFNELMIDKNSSISGYNLRRVAEHLNLTTTFLIQQNGVFYDSGMNPDVNNMLSMIERLKEIRCNFYFNKDKQPFVHHFFFLYTPEHNNPDKDGHVVLISLVFDGENDVLEVRDNLNTSMKSDEKLFSFVKTMHNFFFNTSKDDVAIENLVNKITSDNQRIILQQYKDRIYMVKEETLKHAVDELLKRELAKFDDFRYSELKNLNTVIKLLKLLIEINFHRSLAEKLLIAVYETMIEGILKSNTVLRYKQETIKLIKNAIKKSIKEVGFKDQECSIKIDELLKKANHKIRELQEKRNKNTGKI